ncbi:MAG: acyl carrier protein [Microcoleus sp.]
MYEKVKALVVNQLEVDATDVTLNTKFPDDISGGYFGRHLDTLELIMAIEEEFDIEIPDEAAVKISTVQQAVDYIYQKVAV